MVEKNSMSGTYEASLADLFSELVSVTLEYSGNAVTDIFIYASLEDGVFFDPFFAIKREIFERHKLPGIDTSIDRQRALVKYASRQLEQFAEGCSKFSQPVPSQIKLRYVVATGRTDADLQYEPQWSNTQDVSFHDRSEEWQEQVRLLLASWE